MEDNREAFLKSFVYQLIKDSYKPRGEVFQPMPVTPSPSPFPHMNKTIMEEHFPKMVPSMIHKFETNKKTLPKIQVSQSPPTTKPQQFVGGGMIKIEHFLNDPAVFAIECSGPGRNILVNRSGSIQTAPITLSEEEVKEVLENFSAKTRIPLVQGVFRALYEDLLITAVISEFVGTRFVIQKKTPFQRI